MSSVRTASTDMLPEQKAFLDAVSGSEAPGYDYIYGGRRFSNFDDHPRVFVPIISGPNVGKKTSAAGRYQFLGRSWDSARAELGLTDFSPESQDKAAWHEASKAYKARTGGDLLEAVQAAGTDAAALHAIGYKLSGWWTSLPGGIEPNKQTNSFGTRFAKSLAEYRGQPAPAPTPNFASRLTPADLGPPPPPPSQSETMREAYRMSTRENQATFWNATKAAFGETLTARFLSNTPAAPDPNFTFTPETLKEFTKGLAPDYHEVFERAVSQQHAEWLRTRALETQERNRILEQYGWTGTGLRVTAAILDPISLAVGVASGGLADAAVVAMGAGRGIRTAAQATAGAGANVGLELAERELGDVNSGRHLLLSASVGALFGSAYGMLSRNPALAAETRQLQNSMASLKDELQSSTSLNPAPRSAGAAENLNAQYDLLNDFDFKTVQDKDVAETALKRGRYDAVGQLKSEKNPIWRLLGSVLGEDAVGNAKHSVNTFSASEEAAKMHRVWFADYRRTWMPAYREWYTSQNMGFLDRARRGHEFNEQVYEYVINRDPAREFHPAVARVGDRLRALNKDVLDLANNPGAREGLTMRPVAGFGTVPENVNYMWRSYSMPKLNAARERFGDRGVVEWFKGAIRSAQDDLDDDIVDRIARGVSKRLHQRANDLDDSLSRALHGMDSDTLAGIMREADASEEQIAAVLGRLQRDPQAGADPRGKHRILLDENFVLRNYPVRGQPGEAADLALRDLVLTDASVLSDLYFRHMAGRVALARVRVKNPTTDDMLINGITSDTEFEIVLRRAKEFGADAGTVSPEVNFEGKRMSRAEANARFIYDRVLGRQSPTQTGNAAEWLRLLRKFNFVRVMGQVGFAQIPEFANTVAQVGVRAALSHMPAFRRIVNMDGETILRHGLDRELEAVVGVGTDRLRGMQYFRHDDQFNDTAGQFTRLNNALDYGSKVVSDLSGMSAVNMALQRWTAKVVAQKFANIALNPTKANMRRMASLGIGQEDLNRIVAQVNTHFDRTDGMLFGGKVTRMNLDAWTDQEARSVFENALFRWSRRAIQENDIGTLHRWASNPLWQMMFQFRSFVLTAWHKQFLHNLHMKDLESFNVAWMTTVMGSLTYAVQTQLQAVGRSDKEKFLEERLKPSNLARAGFNRAGWSSIMPMGIDTGAMLSGLNPVFDFRTTGQPTDVLFGNPTMGLIDDLKKASRGVVTPVLEGRSRAQDEYRNIARVFPLQNWMPFVNLLSTMVHDEPKSATQR
jgi:muramidase (phage lysozyme)